MTTKQQSNARKLPGWAQRALDGLAPIPARGASAPNADAVARHAALVKRVGAAWPALCKTVVPQFDQLPDDLVRQRVLDAVLSLLKYKGTNQQHADRRREQKNADKLASAIATKAGELANLLRDRACAIERLKLTDETRDIFDVLECWHGDAEQNSEYAAWASAVERPLQQFLSIARATSQPGPDLAEMLDVVAEGPMQWPMVDARPTQSKKSTLDLCRALLGRLDPKVLTMLGAPADFHFTAAALADLLTALFAEQTSEDVVRKALK